MSGYNPNPSICIPRVFMNIDEHRIRKVFDQLNLGRIARIDIVERRNERGESFKRVFIHFDCWFRTPEASAACQKLNDGKELKIVYDDPWFWKASMNNWAAAPPVRPVARIDWEDERPQRPQRPQERPRNDIRPQRPQERPRNDRPQQQFQHQRNDRPQQQFQDRRPQQQQKLESRQQPQERMQKQQKASVPVQEQLPLKKRILCKKQELAAPEPAAQVAQATKEKEEGEIDESGLTPEELQAIEDLYADLA